MSYSKYLMNPLRMDDETPDEKEPKDEKGPEFGLLAKKMEKYFFENRAVELWGPVDDKSAKEVVTKMPPCQSALSGGSCYFAAVTAWMMTAYRRCQ